MKFLFLIFSFFFASSYLHLTVVWYLFAGLRLQKMIRAFSRFDFCLQSNRVVVAQKLNGAHTERGEVKEEHEEEEEEGKNQKL